MGYGCFCYFGYGCFCYLEIKLEIELEEVLIKEKLLRQHKSRKDCIMHGDHNS